MVDDRPAPRKRRGGRRAGSGWVPNWLGGKEEPKPFLPSLPRHSETGVMQRVKGEPRKRRLARRTFVALLLRWRYAVTFIALMSVLGFLLAPNSQLPRKSCRLNTLGVRSPASSIGS